MGFRIAGTATGTCGLFGQLLGRVTAIAVLGDKGMDWYRLVVFVHIAGAFWFLISHGASINMLFKLRRERDPERIRALLDLSSSSFSGLYSSLLLLLGAGILGGFMGNWWGHGWIWVSLATLVVLLALMTVFGSFYYARIRKAVGLPYMLNFKPQQPAGVRAEELDCLLRSSQPVWLAAIGVVGLAILLWLMIYKPI